MFRILTALSVLVLLAAFQNCSGTASGVGQTALRTGSGFSLASAVHVSEKSALWGRSYSEATALMMVPVPSQEVEILFEQNSISVHGSFPSVCDLSSNENYLQLKALMLSQKICRYVSTISAEERAAQLSRCPAYSGSNGSTFSFALYATTTEGEPLHMTDVLAQSSWKDSMDPYCVAEFTAFCSDTNNTLIDSLAKSLVDEVPALRCLSPLPAEPSL